MLQRLLLCLLTAALTGCVVVPPPSSLHNSPLVPLVAQQPSPTASNQAPFTLLAGGVLANCQEAMAPLLQDYSTANYIYPRLQRQALLIELRGAAAIRHTNYVETISSEVRLDVEALAAAEYFAQHRDQGINGLQQWLQERELLCGSTATCPAIIEQNLDTDPEAEYIFSIGLYAANCGDAGLSRAQQVYLLDCLSDPTNCRSLRIGRNPNALRSACVRGVRDDNGDNFPEIYVNFRFCGATSCWDDLEIAGNDETWFAPRYFVPTLSTRNGCIAQHDLDSDGQAEILLRDHFGYSSMDFDGQGRPMRGPWPDSLEIYSWDGVRYVLADRLYTKDCLYQYIAAGVEWVADEEYERAQALFQSALTDTTVAESCHPPEIEASYPWRAFAQYAVGVLAARQQDPPTARSALRHVADFDPQGIFTPLANRFLNAYQAGEYQAACAAVATYVATQSGDAAFYGPFPDRRLIPFCP